MVSPRLAGCWPDHSPEWYAARRWRIGGSEIGQVMGWSPWGTRDALMARKLQPDTKPQTPAQLRGTLLEPATLTWGTEAKGYTYDPQMAGTWLHGLFDWALYNPDAVTADGLLIECKSTVDRSTEKGWGRAGTNQIPLGYAAQTQWGMAVLGLPEARVLVIHGATNGRPDLAFSQYVIKADKAMQTRLLAAGLRFHQELTAAATAASAA